MPQWAVIGWPGQTGQASLAASSQRVKTKSIVGAPGAANSSQLFERRPSVGYSSLSSTFMREGIDGALGMAAGRKGGEAVRADLAQDRFGEDRAAAVAGAEKQDVEHALSHERPPWVGSKG